jgi:hypothetical protein
MADDVLDGVDDELRLHEYGFHQFWAIYGSNFCHNTRSICSAVSAESPSGSAVSAESPSDSAVSSEHPNRSSVCSSAPYQIQSLERRQLLGRGRRFFLLAPRVRLAAPPKP